MGRPVTTTDQGKRILERIRKTKPFVQASLSITKKRCGNPACRCAQEGPTHETALLTWKEGQCTQSLYIPVALRQEVARWVKEGKHVKGLMAQMSMAQLEFLIHKKRRLKSRKP